MTTFTRPVQLAAGVGIGDFRCGTDVVDRWVERHSASARTRGTAVEFKGQGLGAALLRDAIINAMKIAELAGARALVVDPVDEEARGFYEHFGFTELSGTGRMALKLSTGR